MGILLNVSVTPAAGLDDLKCSEWHVLRAVDPSYTSGNFAGAAKLLGLMLSECESDSIHLSLTSDA